MYFVHSQAFKQRPRACNWSCLCLERYLPKISLVGRGLLPCGQVTGLETKSCFTPGCARQISWGRGNPWCISLKIFKFWCGSTCLWSKGFAEALRGVLPWTKQRSVPWLVTFPSRRAPNPRCPRWLQQVDRGSDSQKGENRPLTSRDQPGFKLRDPALQQNHSEIRHFCVSG